MTSRPATASGSSAAATTPLPASKGEPYASFEDMLDSEGAANVNPDSPCEQELANIRRIYGPKRRRSACWPSSSRLLLSPPTAVTDDRHRHRAAPLRDDGQGAAAPPAPNSGHPGSLAHPLSCVASVAVHCPTVPARPREPMTATPPSSSRTFPCAEAAEAARTLPVAGRRFSRIQWPSVMTWTPVPFPRGRSLPRTEFIAYSRGLTLGLRSRDQARSKDAGRRDFGDRGSARSISKHTASIGQGRRHSSSHAPLTA